MPLTLSMPSTKTVSYATEPENAEHADVPDSLTWTASPTGLVELSPDSSPSLACSIRGLGAPGTVVVTVSDGTISDTITITLQDVTPTSLNLRLLNGPA